MRSRTIQPGPRVTAGGFTPVTVELVPIKEGETRVVTKGFDLDTGLPQSNESVMTDAEADNLAQGMLDHGWQEVPIQLRS